MCRKKMIFFTMVASMLALSVSGCMPAYLQQPVPTSPPTPSTASVQVGVVAPTVTEQVVAPNEVEVVVPAGTEQALLSHLDKASQIAPWAGTYRGSLTCGDCERIDATVELTDDGSFMLTKQYVGRHNTVQQTGRFVWDDSQRIVTLVTKQRQYRFEWQGNQLVLLGNESPLHQGAVLFKQ